MSTLIGIVGAIGTALVFSADWVVEHEYIAPLKDSDEHIEEIAQKALNKVVAMEKKDQCRTLWADIVFWRGEAKKYPEGTAEHQEARDRWDRAQRAFNRLGC